MRIWKDKYVKDIFFAVLITITPFLIYSHLLVQNNFESINYYGFNLDHKFSSLEQFVWYVMLKLIPIMLFSIWFITSIYAWYKLITIPIVIFSDSLIRFTILPDFLLEWYSLFISIIFNICLIIILFFVKSYYLERYGNDVRQVSVAKIITAESKRNFEVVNGILDKIKSTSFDKKNLLYFLNLYQIKNFIDENILSSQKDHNNNRLGTRFKIVMYCVLLIIPILFNIHHAIPNDLTELDIGIISISNNGFPTVDILIWLFFVKATFLLTLCVWFITCQYWWKFAILSPIILTAYQIWEMFQDVRYIDAWGNLRAFPFVLFVVLALVFLSHYVKYEFKVSDLHDSLSRELDAMISSKANLPKINRIERRLKALKLTSQKDQALADKHLRVLYQMKEELMRESEG